MDIATLLGTIGGMAVVVVSILLGGDIAGFINIPSIIIVVAGTITAVLVQFDLKTVLATISFSMHTIKVEKRDLTVTIDQIIEIANKARKDSVLSLQGEKVDNEFLQKGIGLLVDGTNSTMIRKIMSTEINYMDQRHIVGQNVLKAFGKFFPAFGMIGTLIGLVGMLRNLSDPSTIGPSMAVALLTTLYGAVLANLFAIPMADKLVQRADEERFEREIILEGVLSILGGDNPRLLKEKLYSYLAPKLRKPTD